MRDTTVRTSAAAYALCMVVAVLFLSTPLFAFAAFTEVENFVGTIIGFITAVLIPFVFAVALIVFLWGMFQYFIAGGADESKREKGKGLIIWAIVGFVLMITIWGIVNLFSMGLRTGMGTPSTNVSPTITPSTNLPEGVDPAG